MTALPPIRVLIVDDSAVVRGALGRILENEKDITVVTTAPNGQLALDALRHCEVDVVLLDVEMPVMDGITTLPRILAAHPSVRVIMASSLTQQGAAITMQALALGATEYISKPSARVGGAGLATVAGEIVAKVRAVGRSRPPSMAARPSAAPHAPAPAKAPARAAASILGGSHAGDAPPRALAIAASTGGPNALAAVLSGLPADFPLPIFITQHMPPVFTALLAQRLQRDTGRACVEAKNGETVRGGHTYIAPGDFHMLVQTSEGVPILRLQQTPPENHCRPAADPMLRSIAAVYGASALAVVLTGMGEDGRRGCEVVRDRGGRVIAQDEASSVVWGMPGAVATAGLAHWILPLSEIAHKISSLSLVGAP
jgi:two-component system, chemotaxis family, protein-glutamate methylesterase/glutaminase